MVDLYGMSARMCEQSFIELCCIKKALGIYRELIITTKLLHLLLTHLCQVFFIILPGFRKICFFFKTQPTGFGDFTGFWALLGFSDFFYLNEQLGSLLVGLAHQLSFHLDLPILQII